MFQMFYDYHCRQPVDCIISVNPVTNVSDSKACSLIYIQISVIRLFVTDSVHISFVIVLHVFVILSLPVMYLHQLCPSLPYRRYKLVEYLHEISVYKKIAAGKLHLTSSLLLLMKSLPVMNT
jgi:hypothetical protein